MKIFCFSIVENIEIMKINIPKLLIKTFELLRLTKIINETYQSDQNLPTLKSIRRT